MLWTCLRGDTKHDESTLPSFGREVPLQTRLLLVEPIYREARFLRAANRKLFNITLKYTQNRRFWRICSSFVRMECLVELFGRRIREKLYFGIYLHDYLPSIAVLSNLCQLASSHFFLCLWLKSVCIYIASCLADALPLVQISGILGK